MIQRILEQERAVRQVLNNDHKSVHLGPASIGIHQVCTESTARLHRYPLMSS